DHKFDPIAQTDYYRLQSAFAGARQGAQTMATTAQIELRNRLSEPLEERRNQVNAQLAALEKRFQERVARQSPEDPKRWTKPVSDPRGITEPFPERPVRKIRLTIVNNDRDPNTAGGTRID